MQKNFLKDRLPLRRGKSFRNYKERTDGAKTSRLDTEEQREQNIFNYERARVSKAKHTPRIPFEKGGGGGGGGGGRRGRGIKGRE